MRKMCERPGCTAPAAVSYGIDHSRLLVWMDNRAETNREMPGRLCARHADALVMPRGWTIEDRREEVPRLFEARHLVDTSDPVERPVRDPSSTRMRRPRVAREDVRSLFDSMAEEVARATAGSGLEQNREAPAPEPDRVEPDRIEPAPDDVETRAIPWTPRLAAAASEPVEESADDEPLPPLGRLMGRAFKGRNDPPTRRKA